MWFKRTGGSSELAIYECCFCPGDENSIVTIGCKESEFEDKINDLLNKTSFLLCPSKFLSRVYGH